MNGSFGAFCSRRQKALAACIEVDRGNIVLRGHTNRTHVGTYLRWGQGIKPPRAVAQKSGPETGAA